MKSAGYQELEEVPEAPKELRDKLKPVFAQFDQDGSGTVSIGELTSCAQTLELDLVLLLHRLQRGAVVLPGGLQCLLLRR